MNCNICPRKCNIDRKTHTGACKMGSEVIISKIMLHMWEEPPISGTQGSGAIFFSGCSLGCVYCQNKDISRGSVGKSYTVKELAQAMLDLQAQGAHNINLVTPTHYAREIREALDLIKGQLQIPVVYNTSGYELETEIAKMQGYVDVFLTDFKYFSADLSRKYSRAPDYFEVAIGALSKMLEIAGECEFDENGIIKKGVIVRHLVLPGQRQDSFKILDAIYKKCGTECLKLSIMGQYTPDFCDPEYKELKRRLTTFEYESVVSYASELGFDGYIQDLSSASKCYTPNFKEGNSNEIKNT